MKRCKHCNENNYCTINASSRGDCTLPCSHLEYERCKFTELKVSDLFEYRSAQYMRTNDVFALNTEHFGSSVNLINGQIVNFPKDTEIIPLKCKIIFTHK